MQVRIVDYFGHPASAAMKKTFERFVRAAHSVEVELHNGVHGQIFHECGVLAVASARAFRKDGIDADMNSVQGATPSAREAVCLKPGPPSVVRIMCLMRSTTRPSHRGVGSTPRPAPPRS